MFLIILESNQRRIIVDKQHSARCSAGRHVLLQFKTQRVLNTGA